MKYTNMGVNMNTPFNKINYNKSLNRVTFYGFLNTYYVYMYFEHPAIVLLFYL